MSKIQQLLNNLNEKEIKAKNIKDRPEDVLYYSKVNLNDVMLKADGTPYENVVCLDQKVAIFDKDSVVKVFEVDPSSGFSILTFSKEEMRAIANMYRSQGNK